MERLDRSFVNDDWLNFYPESQVFHLPRTISYICRSLFKTYKNIAINPPFRFEHMWLDHLDFPRLFNYAWNISNPYQESLTSFIYQISMWNEQAFGHLKKRKEKNYG